MTNSIQDKVEALIQENIKITVDMMNGDADFDDYSNFVEDRIKSQPKDIQRAFALAGQKVTCDALTVFAFAKKGQFDAMQKMIPNDIRASRMGYNETFNILGKETSSFLKELRDVFNSLPDNAPDNAVKVTQAFRRIGRKKFGL